MRRLYVVAFLFFLFAGAVNAQQATPPTPATPQQFSAEDLEKAVARGVVLANQVQRREPTIADYWRTIWQNTLFICLPMGIAYYLANRWALAHGPLKLKFRRETVASLKAELEQLRKVKLDEKSV